MNIVFMGTPEFACPILEMLHQHHNVLLVVTQPDKPFGRKKILTPSPIKSLATKLNLHVFQPEKLKEDYLKIIELKPDLIITAAYGQMLPKELIDQIVAINVHGSLLPEYRGGAPIQYALFDGKRETGITIMYMAFKMDSGDIIKQSSIPIEFEDNYQTLSEKLSLLGAKLLKEVLETYEMGQIKSIPQDSSLVTFAYTLKYRDEKLSFDWTTEKIINRIRGLSPEPGAYAMLHGQTIKFYHARKSDIIIDSSIKPGTILKVKKELLIKTQDGVIEILEILVPGKKKMAVKDFLNGQNIIKENDVFIEGND
jgi:methionyl-tRNA formyltransferase